MKRRSLIKLLALLAVFGLVAAACGDDTETDAEPADAGTAPADVADEAAPTEEPTEAEDPVVVEEPMDEEEPVDELGYTVRNVPADYPSIQAGVDAAEPGDLVLIDTGVYNEAVVVQTDNIVIRGTDRNTVILDGENAEGMENGVTVTSNGAAIENLTVRNYTRNGLFWTGDYGSNIILDGYRASYVTVHNIGVYGIYAFNAVNGQIDNSYAGASDDSSFYIGQCNPCNSLLYKVEAENSQLGYSGTNSTGTTVADSWFHDNMIGVVPNSQDGEELAPNAGTVIVGNLIENNNNAAVPSRNTGFQLGLGTGVILAGVTDNIVERNSIVGNNRAGVTIVDWIDGVFGNGSGRDFLATDNIVRDNIISGSTLDADVLIAIQDISLGAQGNCFSGNTIGGGTNPVDAQTVLPCDGEDTAVLTQIEALITLFNLEEFEPVDYKDIPAPEMTFENMPGDPAADAPMPAIDVPMAIDLDALMPPDPS
jgi:parallel beta helix pectate lyase-like protein